MVVVRAGFGDVGAAESVSGRQFLFKFARIQTAKHNERTHFVRANRCKYILNDIRKKYSTPGGGPTVYVKRSDRS